MGRGYLRHPLTSKLNTLISTAEERQRMAAALKALRASPWQIRPGL